MRLLLLAGRGRSPDWHLFRLSPHLRAIAWQAVILDAPNNTILVCLWARWLRESVGNLFALLPTAGEIAGARELTFYGVRPGMAGASTIVDLTMELLSQIALHAVWPSALPHLVSGQGDGHLVGERAGRSPSGGARDLSWRKERGCFVCLERLPERLDLNWAWKACPTPRASRPASKASIVIISASCPLAGCILPAGSSAPARPGSASGSWVTLCLV